MPTDFEINFSFDFCVHITRYLPNLYRKEITDRKSYRTCTLDGSAATFAEKKLLTNARRRNEFWDQFKLN